jgi:hypothetical protein
VQKYHNPNAYNQRRSSRQVFGDAFEAGSGDFDDEYYYDPDQEPDDEESYGGSGAAEPMFIRITLILSLPWNSKLLDVNSKDYQTIANELNNGISNIYENVPGQQVVNIVNFRF